MPMCHSTAMPRYTSDQSQLLLSQGTTQRRHLWTCRSSRPRSLPPRGPRFVFDVASRCASKPWTYAPHLRNSVTRAPRIIIYKTSILVLRQRYVSVLYINRLWHPALRWKSDTWYRFPLENTDRNRETTIHQVDHSPRVQSTPSHLAPQGLSGRMNRPSHLRGEHLHPFPKEFSERRPPTG